MNAVYETQQTWNFFEKVTLKVLLVDFESCALSMNYVLGRLVQRIQSLISFR